MAEPSLAFAFGLPPERAVKWFEGKGYVIGWDFRATAKAAAGYAHSVAGVARADVLAAIVGELQRSLRTGETYATFKQQLRDRLTRLGWWGPVQVVNTATGETKRVNLSSPRRLETIYRTNVQSAYMAGRYRAFVAMQKTRPYWEYVAIMDSRTRPSHAELNGRVFRASDPIWEVIWPPNGYNCRCRVRALSAQDVAERKIAVSDSAGMTRTEEVPAKGGGVDRRTVIDLPGGKRFSPDLGFDQNPGRAAPWPDVVAPDRLEVLGGRRNTALEALAIAEPRLAAFGAWVDEALGAGLARGSRQVLGYLEPETMAAAVARGRRPDAWVIELEDRLLVGRKAARHADAGDALTVDEWKRLPVLLTQWEAVLWDKDNQTLVYVLPDPHDATKRIKLVLEAGRPDGRVKGAINSVRTAFRVARDSLANTVQFEVLAGGV